MTPNRAFFTVSDKNNEKHLTRLANSFNKFHPDDKLIVFGEDVIKGYRDPDFFYRACPILAMNLFKQGYTEVCKLDVDQIITGSLSDIWTGEYDLGVVLNSNPREMKNITVSVATIDPLQYYNCGLVVMKNPVFVEQWLKLCHSYHFQRLQYREQDLMNLMVHYGNWRVRQLDDAKAFYGLSAKGYWLLTKLDGDKIVVSGNEEWNKEDVELKVIHFAGGNDPQKGNYKLFFPEDVCQRIDQLIS